MEKYYNLVIGNSKWFAFIGEWFGFENLVFCYITYQIVLIFRPNRLIIVLIV